MGSVLDQLVKLRCSAVYFAFNFFQVEVSGYYLSSFLALLLAQLQCSKTLYWMHFISAIGWKWEGLENNLKQSPGAQGAFTHVGFGKDYYVQAQFDSELMCMLWNSK